MMRGIYFIRKVSSNNCLSLLRNFSFQSISSLKAKLLNTNVRSDQKLKNHLLNYLKKGRCCENQKELPCIIIPFSSIILPYIDLNTNDIIIHNNMQNSQRNIDPNFIKSKILSKDQICRQLDNFEFSENKYIGIFSDIDHSLVNKMGIYINPLKKVKINDQTKYDIGPDRVMITHHHPNSNFGNYVNAEEKNKEEEVGKEPYIFSKLCEIIQLFKENLNLIENLKRLIPYNEIEPLDQNFNTWISLNEKSPFTQQKQNILISQAAYNMFLFKKTFSNMKAFLELSSDVNEYLKLNSKIERVNYIYKELLNVSLLGRSFFNSYTKLVEQMRDSQNKLLLDNIYKEYLKESKKSPKDVYLEKLENIKEMSQIIKKAIKNEINFLLDESNFEITKRNEYLDNVFKLPWDNRGTITWDVNKAKTVLESTHYGMNQTKNRIYEFIAKHKRKSSTNGIVLLLKGPPGVGKTTIAQSIAECLGLPSIYISLAGQSDANFMKGFQRVYIDSQPGIFVKEIQRVKIKNPVIILDEIDKTGTKDDYDSGDVLSTLLEILNVEQNSEFTDFYLEIPFDLSECIFICISNTLDNLIGPLIDRIEIIDIPSYSFKEKFEITRKYSIPRLLKEYQLENIISFSNESIELLIKNYCYSESGIRNLRMNIDAIIRKLVNKIEKKLEVRSKIIVESKDLIEFIGSPLSENSHLEIENSFLPIGMANGLSYIKDGNGSLLQVHFQKKNFNKNQAFTLTGNLGDIFKDSVNVVLNLVINFVRENKIIEVEDSISNSFHLHLPQFQIQKEGPSAGAPMFVALISLLTSKSVPRNLALSGEISSQGEVLPIGGIREKFIACKTHSISNIIFPEANRREVNKLSSELKENINLFPVSTVNEIYEIVFKKLINQE